MDITKEVEKVMLSAIKDNAKRYQVDITSAKLLLGLESLTTCTVLLKIDEEIKGKLSLKSILGIMSIFYSKVNDFITNALIKFSDQNNIEKKNVFVEVKTDSSNKITLTLFNGFKEEVKGVTIEEIVN
jgi:hypothetical protein